MVSYPSSPARASRVAVLVLLVLLLLPATAPATTSLLDLDVAGPQETDGDRETVELGVRFSVTGPFEADGIAFYRAPGHGLTGGAVHLWQGEQLVASGRANGGANDGWVRVDFADGAHTLSPGADYVASYTAVGGDYVATPGFFESPYTSASGDLRAPVDAGVYRYGEQPRRPTSTWASSSYWVTVYGEEGASEEEPPAPSTGPWSLIDSQTFIANPYVDDFAQVELGVRFQVDDARPYKATAIRLYRDPRSAMADNFVFLYDEDGVLVGRGRLSSEGGFSGLLEVRLDEPVRLASGTTYTASYRALGGYPEEQRAFADPVHAGPLSFPAEAGVYRYGGGFPESTWQATSYYVSPVVDVDTSTPEPDPVGAPGDVTSPVVSTAQTFINGSWPWANYPQTIQVPVTETESPLREARLYVDGELRQRVSKYAFRNYLVFLLFVPPGSHTITVEAEDAAGNVGTSSTSFLAR